jgi:hypothetical protein
MRLVLEESTSQNIVGVKKAYARPSLVTTSVNTDMPMELLNQKAANRFFSYCHIATQIA